MAPTPYEVFACSSVGCKAGLQWLYLVESQALVSPEVVSDKEKWCSAVLLAGGKGLGGCVYQRIMLKSNSLINVPSIGVVSA